MMLHLCYWCKTNWCVRHILYTLLENVIHQHGICVTFMVVSCIGGHVDVQCNVVSKREVSHLGVTRCTAVYVLCACRSATARNQARVLVDGGTAVTGTSAVTDTSETWCVAHIHYVLDNDRDILVCVTSVQCNGYHSYCIRGSPAQFRPSLLTVQTNVTRKVRASTLVLMNQRHFAHIHIYITEISSRVSTKHEYTVTFLKLTCVCRTHIV